MVLLHFKAKVDLVVRGRIYNPSALSCTFGLGEATEGKERLAKAGEVTGFTLAAWLGGGSQEFCASPIAADGTAEISLDIKDGDVNTLKLCCACTEMTLLSPRCCHIASDAINLPNLCQVMLENKAYASSGDSEFSSEQKCVQLCDNFSRNTAIIRVRDVATDHEGIAGLHLRPSSLGRLDETNAAISKLGMEIAGRVQNCAISTLNAGSKFTTPFTFGELNSHLMHYGLMGHMIEIGRAHV